MNATPLWPVRPKNISILLLESKIHLGQSIEEHLVRERSFVIAGVARDCYGALQMVRTLRPSLLVAGGSIPAMSFLGMVGNVSSHFQTRAVLLNAPLDSNTLTLALGAGIMGYLSADATWDEGVSALKLASAGERAFSASVTRLITAHYMTAGAKSVDPKLGLTPREQEIYAAVLDGRTSKEIAKDLGLSTSTVQKHRENISRKTA